MKTQAPRQTRAAQRQPATQPQDERHARAAAAGHPREAAQRQRLASAFGAPVQRAAEEEEPLQGRFGPAQRVEEEEPLQGRFAAVQRVEEEDALQGRFAVQRVEEEEPLQGRFAVAQRETDAQAAAQGGLPAGLRAGIERLSGVSMDGVRVHYNSSQPAQLNALAYAQGTDIHLGPGQEQHLPHEAWHIVQQAQGRVQPTMNMNGHVPVNDDAALEHEADTMGAKAVQRRAASPAALAAGGGVVQRFDAGIGAGWHIHFGEHIKYNSTDGTRVNFGGRTRRDIGFALEGKIQDHGLAATKTGADFRECMTWIRNHIA